ncbi:MAG TPA: ATP-binding protein [Aquabacterium sp.]|nr:ATP-binding protein [Aquabacterium sp.]HRH28458.1 ATP-binding protein [Aquabacterium sp.]
MRSLRVRLVRTLLAALLPIWLIMALVSYWSAVEEVDEIYDLQLQESARPLLPLSVPEIRRLLDRPLSEPLVDEPRSEFAVIVWNAQGQALYRSPVAPPLGFSDHLLRDSQASVRTVTLHGGERWRVQWFEQVKAGRWMAVMLPLYERDELAMAMAVGLASPVLLAMVLLVPLVFWAVRRGLAPLQAIGQQVAQRLGQDLSHISGDQVPSEVQPLLHEINALLGRLGEALAHEKRFTADASHELRTPLAAAQVQVEVALGAQDEAVRQAALMHAQTGLTQASRLTEQLLLLSRLDHQWGQQSVAAQVHDVPGWRVGASLGEVVREVVADLSVPALGAGLELSLDLPDQPCLVSLQPDWFSVALRNVLSNAIKFTPEGGQVHITVTQSATEGCVSVHDSGPGVPAEQLAQLSQRFFRGDHAKPGAGLGLSIVARVMAIHQGQLRFEQEQGLKVSLVLPRVVVSPP